MPEHTAAEYDADEDWAAVGPHTWLPMRFRATRTTGPRRLVPDITVVVHVELVDPAVAAGVTVYDEPWPTPVARTVAVSRTYGEVFEKDLRDVPVVELVEDAAAAVRRPDLHAPLPGQVLERGGRTIRRVAAPPAPGASGREVRQSRTPLRKGKIDLGLVAHAYEEAQKAGRKDTNVAVAERIGRSRSRAADYIREARRAGLLPPVPRRTEGRNNG